MTIPNHRTPPCHIANLLEKLGVPNSRKEVTKLINEMNVGYATICIDPISKVKFFDIIRLIVTNKLVDNLFENIEENQTLPKPTFHEWIKMCLEILE